MDGTRRLAPFACLLVMLSQGLSGCGGGSGTHAEPQGSAVFRVTWPEASRLIPEASSSIKIVVKDGEKVVGNLVLSRPKTSNTTEGKIGSLPVKTLTNVITAHPFPDGTGVAQAEGTVPVTIKANEEVKVSVTLQSTITELEPLVRSPIRLGLNQGVKLGAVPKNAAGEMVLILRRGLRFESSNPTALPVNAEGIVTAQAEGTARVTVTEPESGKTYVWDVSSVGCTVPPHSPSPCATVTGFPAQVKVGESYEITIIASDAEDCINPGRPASEARYGVYYPGASIGPNAIIRPGENRITMPVYAPQPGHPECYVALQIEQSSTGIGPNNWRSIYYAEVVK